MSTTVRPTPPLLQSNDLCRSNTAASCMSVLCSFRSNIIPVRRLTFPLPPPDAKLAVIRKQIAEYTQMPPDSFKLVHAGAVMKDDNAPSTCISIYSPFRQPFAFLRS